MFFLPFLSNELQSHFGHVRLTQSRLCYGAFTMLGRHQTIAAQVRKLTDAAFTGDALDRQVVGE
jgi:hypothetical protein